MKKTPKKKIEYLIRQHQIIYRNKKRQAGYERSVIYRKKHKPLFCAVETKIHALRKSRKEFQNKFYKRIKYNQPEIDINIERQLGIESNFTQFIETASTFVDSRSNKFNILINNCTRLWPSAITLLCSLRQWTEITAGVDHRPIIASSNSNYDDVNKYLEHCGFYKYVGVSRDKKPCKFNDNETVKIVRENNKSEIGIREDAIFGILEKYSSLSPDQIEEFNCVVLTEAFNNVSEHGHSNKDNGWWTLTQYHKITGIISLCIADNGIGIKNSLKTGPQQHQLEKLLGHTNEDGEYIKAALDENISGALRASTKEFDYKKLGTVYDRGSRRGNGLSRIKETCQNCGIEFSLLSQKGYLNIKPDGTTGHFGTATSKIFSGTLYHFSIPTKIILEDGHATS